MKYNKKFILILATLASLPISIYCQLDSITNFQSDTTITINQQLQSAAATTSSGYDLQSLILPSPEVRAITRYGDYPVGYSTGIPDISVPLYSIKSGSINLPISMKFHPSGRRPEDREGILGFGWTLDCGGIVTRTRRGLCDDNLIYKFLPYDSLKSNDVHCNDMGEMEPYRNFNTAKIFWNLASSKKASYNQVAFYDSQYDIFSYVLPSSSGKFLLIDTVIQGVSSQMPFTIPYRAIKVKINSYQSVSGINFIKQLILTDIDGTEYYFGKSLINENVYMETSNNEDFNYGDDDLSTHVKEEEPYHISAWNMTGIISANKADTVSFEYGEAKTTRYLQGASPIPSNCTFSIKDKFIQAATISGCQSELGSDVSINSFDMFPKGQLNYSGRIYSTARIKQIMFKGNQIDFNVDTSEKLLNSFDVKNTSGDLIKRCVLGYSKYQDEIVKTLDFIQTEDTIENKTDKYTFEYYRGIMRDNLKSKDWWGYYNGQANQLLVPTFNIEYINHSQSATSLSIPNNCYETSGYVNRNVNSDFQKIGMIKKINYPTGGSTEFLYESNTYKTTSGSIESGPGLRVVQINNKPVNGIYESKTFTYEDAELPEQLKPQAENFMEETRIRSFHAAYSFNEYMDYRMRVYSSNFVLETTGLSSTEVHYKKVTETINQGTSNTFNTTYYFNPLNRHYDEYNYIYASSDDLMSNSSNYSIANKIKYIKDNECWKGGQLFRKEECDKTGKIIRATTYGYTGVEMNRRLELNTKTHFQFVDNTDNLYSSQSKFLESSFGNKLFCYALKEYVSGKEVMTEMKDSTDQVVLMKNFEYDPTYLQITKEIVWDSRAVFTWNENESMYTNNGSNIVTEYKYPFQNPTNPYIEMVTKNILSPVIEKTIYRYNDQLPQKTITNYYKWPSGLITPQTIQTQFYPQVSPDTRVTYESYDKHGNPLSIIKDGDARIIYVWSYGGQYPIAEIKNATYDQVSNAIPGFISYITSTSNPSDVMLNSMSSSLRSGLPNAQVTTYTYKPLVGMTSKITPNGVVTTYEYDSFNRLKLIKDKDGKIIQSFEYNYQH